MFAKLKSDLPGLMFDDAGSDGFVHFLKNMYVNLRSKNFLLYFMFLSVSC